MAFIDTIAESDATGPLADLYRRYANPDATVDNVLKVHSLNPESLEAHGVLYVQSMHRPSPLSRVEREILGVTVSRLNGCRYCLEHHAAGLARLLPADRKPIARALGRGEVGGLTARERALGAYAERLTRQPDAVARADIDALRGAGLTDREIVDAAQVIAYFAFANRIVLGLGAELETHTPIGQWPDARAEAGAT
jgi:uncharacterized peroxidase-related enzyme